MPIGILRRLERTDNAGDVFAMEKKRVQATEQSNRWTDLRSRIRSRLYKEYFTDTRPSCCQIAHFLNRLRKCCM